MSHDNIESIIDKRHLIFKYITDLVVDVDVIIIT
jgi:hypothetical protein